MNRTTRIKVLTALAILAGATSSAAQTYPARPITIVVPFAAGVSWDAS